ncbi:hypothetical protein BHK98_01790 [Hornefia porci]|uniref:Thioredoxin-like fold domain-containing protein n=1 Tax=Hornefia porci TaxID=2652292 RepID=A0A1Q9JFA3_9FIRM|nr:thioredoxin family protein [Hornefia porci]OLR54922.1 hypothetical protein BHK98_01790 [Hornefia porci]
MALFGKKKEEKITKTACCCGETAGQQSNGACCCGETAEQQSGGACCCGEDAAGGISNIKVLGTGCKSCRAQYENAKKAVEQSGLSVEVEYITDIEKVMEYSVMSMPALVVNDRVVSAGKVLKPEEIEQYIGSGAAE